MTQHLIVVGGAGKGLLQNAGRLGIDGLRLEIDTEEELTTPVPTGVKQIAISKVHSGSTAGVLHWAYRNRKDANESAHQINQAYVLTRHWPVAQQNLRDGLSQSPAVGGAVFHAEENPDIVGEELAGIRGGDIVWIVSSTAGGTGAGLHGQLVAMLAKQAHSEAFKPALNIHELRIGWHTYREVSKTTVRLNNVMGIFADGGILHDFAPWDPETLLPDPNEHVHIRYYYFEVPTPPEGQGVGPIGYEHRNRDTRVILTSVFNPEVLKFINSFLSNGVGQFKVEGWGYQWNETDLLRESVASLRERLTLLMQVRSAEHLPLPSNPYSEDAQTILAKTEAKDSATLESALTGRNKFYAPPQISSAREWEKALEQWNNEIYALTGHRVACGTLQRSMGQGIDVIEPKSFQSNTGQYREVWFKLADRFHFLASGYNDFYEPVAATGRDNKFRQLMIKAQAVHTAISSRGTEEQRSKPLSDTLPDFVEMLGEALTWSSLWNEATKWWHAAEQQPALSVLDAKLMEDMRRSGGEPPTPYTIFSANLRSPYKSQDPQAPTWLEELVKASNNNMRRPELVNQAAVGLTYEGLMRVLGLPSNATPDEVRTQLNEPGTKFPGEWFNDAAPRKSTVTRYLLFPQLEQESLEIVDPQYQTRTQIPANYTFIQADLNQTELYILGFSGVIDNTIRREVVMARLAEPDTVWIQRQLAETSKVPMHEYPFLFILLRAFSSWDKLDVEMMFKAKWTEDMLARLAPCAHYLSNNITTPDAVPEVKKLLQRIQNEAQNWTSPLVNIPLSNFIK